MSTVCGSGRPANFGNGHRDGAAGEALLSYPVSLAVDRHRQVLVLDMLNNRVKRWDPIKGSACVSFLPSQCLSIILFVSVGAACISTIAGSAAQGFSDGSGYALHAAFNQPKGLCVDPTDNSYIIAYVARRQRCVLCVVLLRPHSHSCLA